MSENDQSGAKPPRMNRRKLLGWLALPALTIGGGAAYGGVQRGKNPYYDGPVSTNFDGLRFTDGRRVTKGFGDFLKWQIQGGRAKWPENFPALPPDRPPPRVAGLRIAHLGHASALVQVAGLNILIDPVLSERASPFSFVGPKRVNAPGVAFDDLPKIDAVLLTHNHYDHLDMATLERLHERDRPRLVMPLGNDTILNARRTDWTPEAFDWGETVTLSDHVSVTLTPSYHWSARGALDRRMALWCAFLLKTPSGLVYHIGDTGYHDGAFFRALKAEHGAPRVALLPIGAFEPRWFMRDNHMNPEEAVRVMEDCGAKTALGHHWGTFQLTNEAIETPREELAAARDAKGIAPERFPAMQPGFVWEG
jgi:L-ascorbate metabolism protein UlaG (beta-lactamase superfamily)